MPIFNFSLPEILTFFAVLVRYSVLLSIIPFVGDRAVPTPIKILLGLVLSIALFPALVASGQVKPEEAVRWGASVGGITGTIALEIIFALALGFTARLVFDGINLGANLMGNFMGFAAASTFDHHQETQTEIIGQLHMVIAMLIFLALDGHHLMLRASLDSYKIVGLGKAEVGSLLSQRLIQMTGEVIRFGLQFTGPIAVSLFAVNVAFGVMSKSMPQLNIFVLSFTVSALIGFLVMFLSTSELQGLTREILAKMTEWMESIMLALASRR